MTAAIVIPFRDRGIDPLRRQNLDRVLKHWADYPAEIHIVDDGRSSDQPFNRSRAYNHGAAVTDADVLIYTESDMLIPFEQINQAVDQAFTAPGLVVPFTEYRYLSPEDSERVRQCEVEPQDCEPAYARGGSIGAINVISRHTLDLIGQWDENFEGSWYDDDAMKHAFEICAGPTRYVTGPAYHLYHLPGAASKRYAHLPGWNGEHLTDADRDATDANRARYQRYLAATTPEEIRALTCESVSV